VKSNKEDAYHSIFNFILEHTVKNIQESVEGQKFTDLNQAPIYPVWGGGAEYNIRTNTGIESPKSGVCFGENGGKYKECCRNSSTD
jgi:hypothetical protein